MPFPKPRESASLLLSGLLLAACGSSSTGPEPLDTEAYPIGDYAVMADRIVIGFPPSVRWYCSNDVLVADTSQREPDTVRYRISGDRLRIFRDPDSIYAPPDRVVFEAVVQRYSDFLRASGGTGLEGRWQSSVAGYEVVSGTLGAASKAEEDLSAHWDSQVYRYVTTELEFSGGEVRGRVDGRFADYFVEDWNGNISPDSGLDADSARYDIEVKAVDRTTVRLRGRKNGETVTLTFVGPRGTRHYSSDNPEHSAYTATDPITTCPQASGARWFPSFQTVNLRVPLNLPKGADPAPNRPSWWKLEENHRFFRPWAGRL